MKMPKAYSYLRFSTPEQSKGDSRRRQNDAARAYAKQNGLDLDAKLTFQDLGVSAFRGKNREKGALGLFLAAVINGQIPKGSYLLVEDFDRLSRDELDNAYDLFRSILKLGINIATLDDEKLYTRASLNNLNDMIRAQTRMDLAHAESLKKSNRLSGSWKNKRDKAQSEGRKLTARCPAWLTLASDRKSFTIDSARKKVVRRIFDMTIAGHGKSVIARRFNAEPVATFGKSQGWHPSYVQKVLESEAVCGVFQPMRMKDGERVPDGDPIANYFPVVVDRATFERARRSREARRIPAGRKGETFSNLFTGLAFCGNCGAALHYVNKGQGKGGAYLVCSNSRRAVSNCKAPSWRYEAVETLMIRRLRGLNFDELFPAIASSARAKLQELEDSRLETKSELARTKQRMKNIIKEIEEGAKSRTLAARLEDLEAASDKLSATVTEIERQLEEERDRARHSRHDLNELNDSFARLDGAHATRSPELYELRSRLHQLLKRVVARIVMSPLPPSPPRNPHDPIGDLIGWMVVSYQSTELTQAFFVTKGMKQAIDLPMQHRNGKVLKADIQLLLNPRILTPEAAR